MKLGILSDSHDNLPFIAKALALFEREGVDCLVHAGDYVAPFAMRALLKFKGRVLGVFGNNDGEKVGLKKLCPVLVEPPHVFELGGRRILVTHDLQAVTPEQKVRADVLIYGHNHKPEIQAGRPLVINPGECGAWLSGVSTVAVLDTDTLTAQIRTLA